MHVNSYENIENGKNEKGKQEALLIRIIIIIMTATNSENGYAAPNKIVGSIWLDVFCSPILDAVVS